MHSKDYYKILELEIGASEQDIKKAYRQMAMKFHPDKNEGDRFAESRFKEVAEAYEVLSDPRRRSAYNQQRWYGKSTRQTTDVSPVTSHTILERCRALNKYMFTLEAFHINQPALNRYLVHLLSATTLNILLTENNIGNNQQIIKELLQAASPLPYKSIENITGLLRKIAGIDGQVTAVLDNYLREKKLSYNLKRYTPAFALLIALILCLLIYLVSNTSK